MNFLRSLRLCGGFCFLLFCLLTPAVGKSVADAQWREVKGVKIPIPPAEHPRLYLRARDLDGLKRRTSHPVLQPVWERLQREAKDKPQTRAEVDALRYLLTRDPALGKATVQLALDTLERSSFDLTKQDITRPIGRMMVTGAMVYDWCYPLLTAEQKKRFLDQFLRLARQLECGYPPKDNGSVTGHGSEWMIMRDMLSAGVAIYDEYPEMYELAANRFFSKHLPARNWWYPGHAFHQGSAYAETRFVSDMYPLWIFDRLGAGNVFNPEQQYVPYQWIYMRRPDGQLLRSGDGQFKSPQLRSLLCASYYGDGYVLADYLKSPGRDDQIFAFLWRDPDLKPRPIEELPLSWYMDAPYGWMVSRTGWGSDSVIAEMKVNVYNFTNHQHNDAGAFQIYYKGPLAIDSGIYQGSDGGYGSPHHSNYAKRTIAHNSLLIYDPDEKFKTLHNDGGQRLPHDWREPRDLETLLDPANGYKTGTVLGHTATPEYTYLSGDITPAYSPKVREVKRAFVFSRIAIPGCPAALIVFDKVVSSNPAFKKYWLLHSIDEPAIQGNSFVVSRADGKLVDTVLLPEPANTELSKVGGPGKEFWVFGENFPNKPKNDDGSYEPGAWRVELSPKRPAATDYFLNVIAIMDRGTKAPAIEKIEGRSAVGAKIGNRLVMFDKETMACSVTSSPKP